MRTGLVSMILLPLAVAALGTQALAVEGKSATTGQREFSDKCAACHGSDGKGRGPVAEFLKVPPADLTLLTKKNGGVFPYLHVEAMIDGREIAKFHGDREMPVWGRDYLKEEGRAKEYFHDRGVDMELYARQRVLALIDYLHRLQEK